jgi:hypothetical protein
MVTLPPPLLCTSKRLNEWHLSALSSAVAMTASSPPEHWTMLQLPVPVPNKEKKLKNEKKSGRHETLTN